MADTWSRVKFKGILFDRSAGIRETDGNQQVHSRNDVYGDAKHFLLRVYGHFSYTAMFPAVATIQRRIQDKQTSKGKRNVVESYLKCVA